MKSELLEKTATRLTWCVSSWPDVERTVRYQAGCALIGRVIDLCGQWTCTCGSTMCAHINHVRAEYDEPIA